MNLEKGIIIAIPTYNEIASIEAMIIKLREIGFPFFIIDGGSTDGTVEKVKELGEDIYNRDGFSIGYGGGMNKAMKIAKDKGFRYLGMADCDLTYPIDRFPDLFKIALRNDLVVGARQMKQIDIVRRVGNMIHIAFANILFATNLQDINSGMRVFNIEKFQNKITAKHFGFVAQMSCYALRNNLSYEEIPIIYYERVGESKLRFVDGIIILYFILLERFRKKVTSFYKLSKELKIIFFLLGAFSLFTFVNKVFHIFSFNYNLSGVEDYFVYLILKFRIGELYQDPNKYPYIVAQYPPIYFFTTSKLASLFSLSGYIDEARSIFIAGRFINLLCSILNSCIVAFWFYHFVSKQKLFAALMGGLIVFNLHTLHFLAVRPDALKLMWLLLAYSSLHNYIKNNNSYSHSLFYSAVLFTLAVLTKQDAGFHLFLGCFLILYYKKNLLQPIVLGSIVCLLCFIFFAVLFKVNYKLFYLNLLLGISQGVSWSWFFTIISFNRLTAIALIFLLFFLGYNTFIKPVIDKGLFLALLLLFIFSILSLLKWGGNINYWIEFQIFSLVLMVYYAFQKTNKFWLITSIIIFATISFNNYWSLNNTFYSYWKNKGYKEIYNDKKQVAKNDKRSTY